MSKEILACSAFSIPSSSVLSILDVSHRCNSLEWRGTRSETSWGTCLTSRHPRRQGSTPPPPFLRPRLTYHYPEMVVANFQGQSSLDGRMDNVGLRCSDQRVSWRAAFPAYRLPSWYHIIHLTGKISVALPARSSDEVLGSQGTSGAGTKQRYVFKLKSVDFGKNVCAVSDKLLRHRGLGGGEPPRDRLGTGPAPARRCCAPPIKLGL